MKTINDIAYDIAIAMAQGGETFSAHQVTQEARKYVNKSAEAFDLPPGNGDYDYEVEHTDVNETVRNMFNDGELDRVFNGTYFEYSAAAAGSPSKPAQALTITPVQVAKMVAQGTPTTKPLADAVYDYLKRNGERTILYIFGTVCRWNFPGATISQIANIVKTDDRFVVDSAGDAPSYWYVDIK